MNSETIYSILASKPHNPHYLKRYIKFITWCQQNPSKEDYTEEHHICPKANDLFPEYTDLKTFKWNAVYLSTREHIMAHIMLWKAYGNSQTDAIHYMLSVQNDDTGYNLRKIPTVIQIRYAAKARNSFYKSRKGKSTYKDSQGNKYFIETTDPIIEQLGLVGNNTGHQHSDETKAKQSYAKFLTRNVELYFLDQKVTVPLLSDEYHLYIEQGWVPVRTDEDYDYIKEQSNAKLSEFWTNRMRYMTQDLVYHGSYLKDDPIIKELNLIPLRTEAQIIQNASRVVLATEAKLGTNIYNNGIEEKFFELAPDDSWVQGRLPRSEEWESNRTAAVQAAVTGSKTYTNGLRNMFIRPGEDIPSGFYPGMKCRPNTTYYYVRGNEILSFLGQHESPEGFTKIKEREAKVILKRNLL